MLTSPPRGRELLATLYDAAVSAVAPAPLVSAALGDFDARPDQRCWVFAFGKAAPGMASGAVSALRRSLHVIAGGAVVPLDPEPSPFSTIRLAPGDHPLPGARSLAAGHLVGETASAVRSDDAVVVLVSGGATSLLAAPVRGVEPQDLEQLFVLLMDAGLDITAMNAVRKRFLRWGAGRLAVALAPARTQALLLSDVPGDDPADIGSGPCTPDPSTAGELTALLRDARLLDRLAPSLRDYLASVTRGRTADTPKPGHPAFAHVSTRIIGSNAIAIDAALARARTLGIGAERVTSPLSGEAARCGEQIATTLLECVARGRTGCLVWGGETTVQLDMPLPAKERKVASSPDSARREASVAHGAGGRCQELALAAARVLGTVGDAAARITLLAAGTDGRDGPTDAAGAFADAALWQRMIDAGANPADALTRHRSHAALDAADALFRRAPTGTNVMDLVLAVVE